MSIFNCRRKKRTILVTGGSLGARTLNTSVQHGLEKIIADDVQVIWQTGKFYYKNAIAQLGENYHPNVKILEFLNRMDLAYAAADVIISRAGAGTIAELCIVKKPVILVPSPNVAEDHQTKNAMALVNDGAAIFISDVDAEATLVDAVLALLKDDKQQKILSSSIGKMALPNADEVIAKEVMQITNNN